MALSQNVYKRFPGLASETSANGSARTGATFEASMAYPGSALIFECQATIVTGSVVATFTPQGSDDGSTWYDLKALNNAALVTLAATGNIALVCPGGLPYKKIRCNATLSGATTAAGDLTVVGYRYMDISDFTL